MVKRNKNESYVEQWVAGFVYSDCGEWLFAKTDWCNCTSAFQGKKYNVVIHPSQEAATKHALRFKTTMEDYKVFVRRYDHGEGINNNPIFLN